MNDDDDEARQPAVGPPPDEARTRLAFYDAALNQLREAANNAFAAVPEIRSVAVVLDYEGGLNEANVSNALWIGSHGAVQTVPAIFGSIRNTLGVLEVMLTRAAEHEQRLRENYKQLGDGIVARRKELDELDKQHRQASATAPAAAAGDERADGGRRVGTPGEFELRRDTTTGITGDYIDDAGRRAYVRDGLAYWVDTNEQVESHTVLGMSAAARDAVTLSGDEPGGPPKQLYQLLDREPRHVKGVDVNDLSAVENESRAPTTKGNEWPDKVFRRTNGDVLLYPNSEDVGRIARNVSDREVAARGYVSGSFVPQLDERWWRKDFTNPVTWPDNVKLVGDEIHRAGGHGECVCAGQDADKLRAAGYVQNEHGDDDAWFRPPAQA